MERLERVENKIDVLSDKCEHIAIQTISNTNSLKEHMAQTIEVRKQTDLLKELVDANRESNDHRLYELENFRSTVMTVFRTICYSCTAVVALDKLGVLSFLFDLILRFKQIK